METIWRPVEGQGVFNSIQNKFPIFDPVCNSPYNGTKIRCNSFLVTHVYTQKQDSDAKAKKKKKKKEEKK